MMSTVLPSGDLRLDAQRVVDFRQMARLELDVEHRADDRDNLSEILVSHVHLIAVGSQNLTQTCLSSRLARSVPATAPARRTPLR